MDNIYQETKKNQYLEELFENYKKSLSQLDRSRQYFQWAYVIWSHTLPYNVMTSDIRKYFKQFDIELIYDRNTNHPEFNYSHPLILTPMAKLIFKSNPEIKPFNKKSQLYQTIQACQFKMADVDHYIMIHRKIKKNELIISARFIYFFAIYQHVLEHPQQYSFEYYENEHDFRIIIHNLW